VNRWGCLALLAATVGGVSGARAATATDPPPPLAGVWEVEQLATDGQDSLHQQYHPGDPRLIGRTVVIAGGRVSLRFGHDLDCQQSTWKPQKTTWGYLLSRGFPRPTDGGRSARPSADDFELGVTSKQQAIAYTVCAEKVPGRAAAPAFPLNNWVVSLPGGKIALRADPQFILILRRRSADAKPSAGTFDCSKPANPAESAICSDFDLASWDRSAAMARDELAKQLTPSGAAKLRKAQDDYTRRRGACGTDTACIDKLQQERVDVLCQLRNLPESSIE
jgi:hypothetical protein